jgi:hypothetical protein
LPTITVYLSAIVMTNGRYPLPAKQHHLRLAPIGGGFSLAVE